VAASIAGSHTALVPRNTHILAIAARVIRERGFDATSLRDIAARAHIPLSSIYYHFQTKDDLFVAVYEEGVERLRRAVTDAIAGANDPWERLQGACAMHLHNLCGNDDFMAVSVPTRAPQLANAARERVQQQSDRYERLLTDLIGALELDKGLSRSVLRLQILGALNWTSVWYRPGKMTPLQIASQLIRTVRYGVSASSGKAARVTAAKSRSRGQTRRRA
jgi:AcrR family transcriptional regulator